VLIIVKYPCLFFELRNLISLPIALNAKLHLHRKLNLFLTNGMVITLVTSNMSRSILAKLRFCYLWLRVAPIPTRNLSYCYNFLSGLKSAVAFSEFHSFRER
jgi:hypothetical protein